MTTEESNTETEQQNSDDETSDDSASLKQKSREEFHRGQVYYASSAMQINVYPDSTSTNIEVELETHVLN